MYTFMIFGLLAAAVASPLPGKIATSYANNNLASYSGHSSGGWQNLGHGATSYANSNLASYSGHSLGGWQNLGHGATSYANSNLASYSGHSLEGWQNLGHGATSYANNNLGSSTEGWHGGSSYVQTTNGGYNSQLNHDFGGSSYANVKMATGSGLSGINYWDSTYGNSGSSYANKGTDIGYGHAATSYANNNMISLKHGSSW